MKTLLKIFLPIALIGGAVVFAVKKFGKKCDESESEESDDKKDEGKK